VKPVRFILKTTISEELDEVIYGGFDAFTRDPGNDHPYVRLTPDGPLIPVEDWKDGSMLITPTLLRKIAGHFIELGKRLKEGGE